MCASPIAAPCVCTRRRDRRRRLGASLFSRRPDPTGRALEARWRREVVSCQDCKRQSLCRGRTLDTRRTWSGSRLRREISTGVGRAPSERERVEASDSVRRKRRSVCPRRSSSLRSARVAFSRNKRRRAHTRPKDTSPFASARRLTTRLAQNGSSNVFFFLPLYFAFLIT